MFYFYFALTNVNYDNIRQTPFKNIEKKIYKQVIKIRVNEFENIMVQTECVSFYIMYFSYQSDPQLKSRNHKKMNVNYVNNTCTCSNKLYTKYLQSLVAVGVVKGHVCAGLDPTKLPAVLLRHWGHLQCGACAVRVKGQGQIYIIFMFIL